MSSTLFLWLTLGGWIILLVSIAVVQLKKPHQTSFGPAMLVLGLLTGSSTVSVTHSVWWGLAVVAMALIGYFVLQHVVRVSMRPVSTQT
jgi:hypothetical protein